MRFSNVFLYKIFTGLINIPIIVVVFLNVSSVYSTSTGTVCLEEIEAQAYVCFQLNIYTYLG